MLQLRRWVRCRGCCVACLFGASSPQAAAETEAGAYVKVVNGRCEEAVGVLPLGALGQNWTRDLDLASREYCDAQPWCIGYMRLLRGGDNPDHCEAWCGRPQFCDGFQLSQEDEWVAYLKSSRLLGGEVPEDVVIDDSPPAPKSDTIMCEWPYESAVKLWHKAPDAGDMEKGFLSDGYCNVFHHRRNSVLPRADLGLAGILSDDDAVAPYFSANTTVEPWRYYMDSNSYSGFTMGSDSVNFGPKVHYLSIFFLTSASRCNGREERQWGVDETAEVMAEHVYVEDGTMETRHNAFSPYHFTIICGDLEDASFVPQVLVDALGLAAHPLVPKPLHDRLQRVFFHLPDAVQPFTRIHPLVLEAWVEQFYNDPERNDAMFFKQTFLFLMQELFYYRYRQSTHVRLKLAACALCDERLKQLRLDEGESELDGPVESSLVTIAVCVMSRRSGHALRAAIRETWALQVSRVHRATLRFFVGAGDGTVLDLLSDGAGDVVELQAPEAYSAVTLKAFSMLEWAWTAFPNLKYIVRADDDVYLRPGPIFAHLERRPPVMYLWGNIDHGSNPVRDPEHPHYNSLAQFPQRVHPLFGDIFPPYARGHLWAMSSDLLTLVVYAWRDEAFDRQGLTLDLASRLPHPDDPALGVLLSNLVDDRKLSLSIDDRDLNHFSLNPSCNATYLMVHNRTWVVHHVDAAAMRCMWEIDSAASGCAATDSGCEGEFADLCPCSMEVQEESDDTGVPFKYPMQRFND